MYGIEYDRGGNCNNFIKSLIIYNLTRDTSEMEFINGSANSYVLKMDRQDVIGCHINNIENIALFDEIFKTNNFKYINIYFSSLEDMRISALFHFIKGQGFHYGFKDHFTDLDAQEVKNYFDSVFLPRNTLPESITEQAIVSDTHPYKNNIYWLDFHDILYDKQKTISLIEEVTELEALPSLHENYDRYLDLQYQIISKFS